ncbi:MAG TPA: PAS domain S-box protein [Candidatus Acidoferrales bacterium]|nr:PAS domain S-box protein [Candidatus Acidoferrales bacterium]
MARTSRATATGAAPTVETQPSGIESFQSLLEALQVGVMVNGPNGEIVFANRATLEMFGVTKEQITGKRTRDVNLITLREDGSECPQLMRPVARAIRTKKPIVGEVLGWHRPGSEAVLWTLVTAVPQFTDTGELCNVITTLTDITDRKNTEAALRRAGELNRQILLSAQEGIIVHDRELRYVLWNPYMERMSGVKESEVVGKHPLEVFPFMAASGMYADLQRALAGETVTSNDAHFEVRATNRAGWCDNNFAPLRDAQGEIIGVVATVRDITERKRTDDRLRKSETLLAQAEQLANVGSWESDLKTGRSTLSRNLLQMYGLASEAEWDRDAYWERVHPEDRQRVRSVVQRATLECKPFEFIVRYRSQEGTYRVHFNRAIQIPGPEGKSERSIGVSHDITEQVRAEEELRQLSSRLLQSQELERRRIARELHDSVSQRLLTINLNLAQLGKSDDVRTKHARQILADTRRTVRDLSKEIRSLSYLLHPPLLDELGLASAIEEYAKGFSQRSGIELKFEMPLDVGRLPRESEMALFRIVQEALGNIQKHSGSSRGRIRLAREGDDVVLEICDEGRGMASGDLNKRLASSGTLGVGILGMRERMRQLGGRLEITSDEQGTTVKAVLPLGGEDNHAGSHPASR